MCAIIDANVRDQVFGDNRPKAGEYFFDNLNSGRSNIKLVVGGKLLEELCSSKAFSAWIQTALQFGRAQRFPDEEVETATRRLQQEQMFTSDDEHVLALALVSGARLLFTNDRALQEDFGNRLILGGVRGRVYTTVKNEHVTSTHRSLLRRTNLCSV